MKHQPSDLTHADVRRIILGIMLAMFLGALDQTIVATALPTIGAEFGDFANLPWVVTSYLLAATVATPLYGKLSDIRGRRVMLLISVAVFSLASLACALAPNLLFLIIARAVQGLGGGGLISLAQTIIADVVAPRERPRYQAQIAAVFAAASILGPVMGGFFAQHLHWTLIFWINLPLGAAAYLMTDRTLRRLPRHDRRHDLDAPGAALMGLSALVLLLALNWGGVRLPWGSPEILGMLAASLVLGLLFVWRIRTVREPFISLDMLTDPVVGRAVPAAFAAAGTMVGLSIFVPLYFETVRGLSASQSGLALIPLMGGIVCGAVMSGRLLARLTHYKRPGMIGCASSALLLAAFALAPGSLPLPALVAGLAVVGVGIGTVLPMTTIAIQNAVTPHRMGTATGLMNFSRQLGGAMVVAVLGAVLLGFAGRTSGHDMEELARQAAPEALAGGFAYVFGTAALVLAMGFGFLVAMAERPLRSSVRAAAEEAAGIAE
ncbi:MDR family MFS transporter [Xanthobacter tagetidis]|uniref:MDR family MFS transporter n=1 Tax=Xanthobacter tagetidis TaxID=60216 RepID=UPI00180E07B0|nr:MDR family MFS transporter [Xanthobacter tagetidis]MBB6305855.1 EmrB/QacA subfamily drug resistance transporter [Xanthobacter tagetidis]